MADIKTPIRTVFDGNGEATGLAEFQSGESVGFSHGGTGLTFLGAPGQTLAVNANTDGLEWVTGQDLQNSDELPEGTTNLYFTIPRVRSSISVNGDLTYNSSTGEISVTTYKDADVESYLSGGTGVSFSNGVIGIGQPVGSTDNVTFNDVTVNGVLNSDDVTASQVTVTGDLIVQGNTTTINSTELNISDKTLLLADGSANSSISDGSGLIIDGANSQLTYQSSGDNWFFNKDVKVGGDIEATNFNATSDEILKRNVETISSAVEKTMKLRGVDFTWKSDGKKSMGVIAQEVEKVIPEVVQVGETKTVNYNAIIGLLIESIKEQQKKIDELSKIINRSNS